MRLALVTQIKPLALPWASTDYNTNFHIDVISMCKELKLQLYNSVLSYRKLSIHVFLV